MIEILAKDNEIIPYRKELNMITGGVTATILLQQIIFRFKNNGNKPFYKFIEPCKHEKYKPGDSWCEELGFSRKEFLTAIKKLEDNGLVTKKINMSRVTYYSINQSNLSKSLKGIYINAEKGFTKMPKGDLDNKDTKTHSEITQEIKEIKNKEKGRQKNYYQYVNKLRKLADRFRKVDKPFLLLFQEQSYDFEFREDGNHLLRNAKTQKVLSKQDAEYIYKILNHKQIIPIYETLDLSHI